MLHRYLCCSLLLLSTVCPAQDKPATDTTKKELPLKEVTVTAQKSAFETAPGKTIVNVASLAGNAGKNVLELLRRLPGVTVDGMGNISMTGKQGVLVTIDGRQTYLAGDDLKNYLQGMTAEEVSQIELITQPSARYDAEGNAGIINIKTRKNKRSGLNGTANASYTKSMYENAYGSLLLNYKPGKVNCYTSMNFIDASNTVDWRNDMQFKDGAGNTVATSSMHSVPVEHFQKFNLRAGADYNYSEKTNAGVGIMAANYDNKMHSDINTTGGEAGASPTLTIRNTDESSLRRNGGANAYLKQIFGKTSELNINLDYLGYNRSMEQYLTTDATRDGIALPDQLSLRSTLPYHINVWSARADQSVTLPGGLKLEGGLKHSYVSVDYATNYTIPINGIWQPDSSRSNRFVYTEQISAAYVNATRKLAEHWDAQLGLRAEVANTAGLQMATGESFSRHMPAFFPTAYLNYHPDSSNNLELNYGRRVDRPSYRELNPFNYYTFYNTYQRGNPGLLPQYTRNVELKHTYKGIWTTSLQYSYITDVLSSSTFSDNQTQTTYGMPVNFGSSEVGVLSVTYNNKVRPWWDLMMSAMGKYGRYSGRYSNLLVTSQGGGAAVWLVSQFTLGKYTTELWGNWNSNVVTTPVSEDKAQGFIGLAASRKLWHETSTIKLVLDDPFYINRNIYTSNQPGLYSTATLRSNTRSISVNIAYNFGKTASQTRREKSPDEATRL